MMTPPRENSGASECSAREMTADEWAGRLIGASRDVIALAFSGALARGYREGRNSMQGAVDHFEIAYRYAVNASDPNNDAPDLLASAEIFAQIGYDESREKAR